MTAREGREPGPPPTVAPAAPTVGAPIAGASFRQLFGATRDRILRGAFDYRGDVTLHLDDGSDLVGYLFSHEPAAPEPHVKLYPPDATALPVRVAISRITGCSFTGSDRAAGRSWEAWKARQQEKARLAAEGIDIGDIEPQPDVLD